MHIRQRLYPIANLLRSYAGAGTSIKDMASEVIEICPKEVEKYPKPSFFDDELDKITASVPWGSVEGELSAMNEIVTHASTVKYIVKDVLVHRNGIDSNGGRYKTVGGLTPGVLYGKLLELESVTYTCSAASSRYFGHWLHDACPTALLAREGENIIISYDSNWSHAEEYLDIFKLKPEIAPLVIARELCVYDDYSQNSSKVSRHRELRCRLAAKLQLEQSREGIIFLRRANSGKARLIANEDAVIRSMSQLGIKVVEHQFTSVADLSRELSRAKLIISVEGSHISHAYYSAPERASLLLLIPSDCFGLIHVGLARALGYRVGFTVMSQSENGYVVDTDRVLELVERLLV